MKIELELIRAFPKNNNRYLTCFDDIIATLANWKGISYQAMYANSWDFSYIPEKLSKNSFFSMDSLKPFNMLLNNLSIYHGIDIDLLELNPNQSFYQIILKQINKEMPIIIKLDSFYNNWDPLYKKEHNNHLCLVVAIDFIKKELTICDPYFHMKDAILPFELIDKASNLIGIVSFKSPSRSIKSLNDFSIFSKENYMCMQKKLSNIKEIAKDMEFFLLDNNKISFDHLPFIYKQFNEIILERLRFVTMITHYKNLINSSIYTDLLEKLIEVATRWEIVLNLIAKSIYAETLLSNAQKIVSSIHELSFIETSIFHETFYNIHNYKEKSFKLNVLKKHVFHLSNKSINLIDLFNNKGFTVTESEATIANLTGLGEYFVLDRNTNNLISINKIDFILPNFNLEKDNISCDQQELEVMLDRVATAYFICCAEWGNTLAKFIFVYSDGSEDHIQFNITDLSCEPMYEETIALSGKTLKYHNGQFEIVQEKAYLSMITAHLNPDKVISKIIFPENKNLHILSMTLGIISEN